MQLPMRSRFSDMNKESFVRTAVIGLVLAMPIIGVVLANHVKMVKKLPKLSDSYPDEHLGVG